MKLNPFFNVILKRIYEVVGLCIHVKVNGNNSFTIIYDSMLVGIKYLRFDSKKDRIEHILVVCFEKRDKGGLPN